MCMIIMFPEAQKTPANMHRTSSSASFQMHQNELKKLNYENFQFRNNI